MNEPVIYVTRDLERALGLPLATPGYFIIANFTPFAKLTAAGHDNVLLIEAAKLLDTHELLAHPQAVDFITARTNPHILVFKNTGVIEKICAGHNWHLLNPSATLANMIEEKISQIEWLGDLTYFLPPHQIQLLKEVRFDGTPFVLQFNRAHTGNGTMLIDSPEKLHELQVKFPERPVRVTKYVEGVMCTSNNVVTATGVLVGNISYQITGLAPFTDQPFVTVGNDWRLGNEIWRRSQLAGYLYTDQYFLLVEEIGKRLGASGWRGLFGIDFVVRLDEDGNPDNLYLIEINSRQPASTTYESWLQKESKIKNQESGMTTFEAHLLSLLGADLAGAELIEVDDGAQIILRNQNGRNFLPEKLREFSNKLMAHDFNIIPYTNSAPGSDVLRIQSATGIMNRHREFNERGVQILKCLT